MARKKLLSEGEVRQFMKLANLGPLSENYFSNNPLGEQDEEDFAAAEVDPEGGEELELGAMEDEVPLDDAGLEGEEGGEAEGLVMGLLQVIQPWAEEHGVDMELDGDEEGGEEEVEDIEAVELEEPGGEEEFELGAEEEEVPGNYDLSEGEGSKRGEFKRRGKGGKVGKKAGDVGGHYKDDEDANGAEMDEGWAGDTGSMKSRLGKTRSKMGTKDHRGVPPVSTAGPTDSLGGGAGDVGADEDAFWANLDPEEKKKVVAQLREGHIVAEVARRVAARLSADKQKETVADQLAERIFKRLTSK
jgi:hypothetical protein